MAENGEKIKRFGIVFRIQHIILFTCVLALIFSGLPLKFPNSSLAHLAVKIQGGMEMRATIHHTAGLTLIFLGIFHFLYHYLTGRKVPILKRPIMVRPSDITDFLKHIAYSIGLRKKFPPMGRYTWYEKLDYFGLIWGFILMAVTGLAMLYMDIAIRFIPMSWLQALWAAHSEEAMLATLFLLIIHMYHVHFNPEKFPMALTWLTGKISRKEMEKYHPLELEQLENSKNEPTKP